MSIKATVQHLLEDSEDWTFNKGDRVLLVEPVRVEGVLVQGVGTLEVWDGERGLFQPDDSNGSCMVNARMIRPGSLGVRRTNLGGRLPEGLPDPDHTHHKAMANRVAEIAKRNAPRYPKSFQPGRRIVCSQCGSEDVGDYNGEVLCHKCAEELGEVPLGESRWTRPFDLETLLGVIDCSPEERQAIQSLTPGKSCHMSMEGKDHTISVEITELPPIEQRGQSVRQFSITV